MDIDTILDKLAHL